jgi:hypothetical protein
MKGSSTGEHFDSAYKLQAQLGSGASFRPSHCTTSYMILCALVCVCVTCKDHHCSSSSACFQTAVSASADYMCRGGKTLSVTEEISPARPDLASPSTRTL